jgi:amino acid transporter
MVIKTALLSGMAAGMGLLVSPDHLRMWGNLAGHLGAGFWLAVIGAIIVYASSAGSYRRLAGASAGDGGYLSGLQQRFGVAGVALALASRLSLAAGLSTGVLVTAGFVFNETFVYWFPNFAFAYICLGAAALFHLGGYRLAQNVQTALVALAMLGLLILSVAGFWNAGPPQSPDPQPPRDFGLIAVLGSLLLFVGFDFNAADNSQAADRSHAPATMSAALFASAIVLGLWSAVGLAHVQAERLADSFIPYSLAARQIGGQLGRYLIGIVVIAGSLSAVIALFNATARMVADLAQKGIKKFLPMRTPMFLM